MRFSELVGAVEDAARWATPDHIEPRDLVKAGQNLNFSGCW